MFTTALFLAMFLPTVSLGSLPMNPTSGLIAPIVDSVTVNVYSEQRVPFRVRFGEAAKDYRVMAMFVLPGEVVPVSVLSPGDYEMRASAGATLLSETNEWSWVAPLKTGLYPIEFAPHGSSRGMTLNVFVMVPFDAARGGSLNGYRIGRYPRSRSEFYEHPRGFVEVTPELRDVEVSPHFRLGQFVCKQAGGPPAYVVLRQPLREKLEEVLAAVNASGREAHGFTLLSGYRTPLYNAAIGNETRFSRHHYGDAADIFVDGDGDGRMDDLNRDGRHTLADARWLGAIVERVTQQSEHFEGG